MTSSKYVNYRLAANRMQASVQRQGGGQLLCVEIACSRCDFAQLMRFCLNLKRYISTLSSSKLVFSLPQLYFLAFEF